MDNTALFNDFQPVSKKEWLEKIEKDLKGKPYSDLVKTNGAQIQFEAAFTAEDINLNNESPGAGSYRRSSKVNDNSWVIEEGLQLTGDAKEDNKTLLARLNAGLTGITLEGNPNKDTLNGVLPQYITMGFDHYDNLESITNTIIDSFGPEAHQAPIHLNFDPIGKGAVEGKFELTSIQQGIAAKNQTNEFKQLRVFSVNAYQYHNAGGNAVSELAFALAHAHEYLVYQLENGMSIDDASANIKINLASGGDYFLELAKFRAFRVLWAKVIDTYHPEHSCSKTSLIHTRTSQFLSTLYDPHVNMLRATTQAMAAVLGGSDMLRVLPYSTAWKAGNDFSLRIARNTQLLLKEESYFDKVIDPAGGSYYVEYLTEQLAEKTWMKFQKIEKKGGFIGLMTSGNLCRELEEDAQEQLDRLNNRSTKVLGVTLYPNSEEKKIDELQETAELEKGSTDYAPIEQIRLVGEVEESRLNEELKEAQA